MKRQRFFVRGLFVLCMAFVGVSLMVVLTRAHAPSGAIFTTTDDGSRVNANIYPSKKDVYLDGGPGPNAPQDAAGLDDGIYVFQVTDPSGKVLLSTDAAACRVVEVSEGVITAVLDWDGAGTELSDFAIHVYGGGNTNDDCHKNGKNQARHDANQDEDHGPPAIVVQLMPYLDTPNPGGVYKAWMTRIEDYLLGCHEQGFAGETGLDVSGCGYAPGNFHGFIPAHSKTDNFKVREKNGGGGGPQASLTVKKYCDTDCDGMEDVGSDATLDNVTITVLDEFAVEVCSGVTVGGFFDCQLPGPGTYTVIETIGADLAICGASIDGVSVGPLTEVEVTVENNGTAVVEFFNTATDGEIVANKRCAVGSQGPIAGVQMDLSGTDILGQTINETGVTDAAGQVTFSGLAAGDYTVTETVPAGLVAIGPTTCDVSLTVDTSMDPSGLNQCTAGSATCDFENVAVGNVGARTPGFWCVQVLRDAGENPGTEAACFQRLECAFPGGVQDVVDAALVLAGPQAGLYDLDEDGSVSNAEAQLILCPQEGEASHAQCRRQSFALLMNLAGHLDEDDNPECGAACAVIGTTTGQVIVVDGQLTTVGAILDRLLNEGCTDELHAIIQGINENTITVLDDCPPSV